MGKKKKTWADMTLAERHEVAVADDKAGAEVWAKILAMSKEEFLAAYPQARLSHHVSES